jgi:hypothetical protein
VTADCNIIDERPGERVEREKEAIQSKTSPARNQQHQASHWNRQEVNLTNENSLHDIFSPS